MRLPDRTNDLYVTSRAVLISFGNHGVIDAICVRAVDPETKVWMQQHLDAVFGFPSLVRFSWATCKVLLAEAGVEVYWLG